MTPVRQFTPQLSSESEGEPPPILVSTGISKSFVGMNLNMLHSPGFKSFDNSSFVLKLTERILLH